MGAPKQKWTAEEEAALKAGIVKHGAGKWRTILKDPEFSSILFLRSNVDLKDKWRNMCVMPGGFGSRDRSRLALKRVPTLSVAVKQEDNATSASDVAPSDEDMPDVKPVIALTPTSAPSPTPTPTSAPSPTPSPTLTPTPTPTPTPSAPPPLQISSAPPPLQISSAPPPLQIPIAPPPLQIPIAPPPVQILSTPKRSIVRLDNLIMEAITTLKEHGGSNKTAIASYIEDQYWAPPDFKRVLSAKLKFLTSSGKLIKVKRKYRISPSLAFPENRRSLSMIAHESRQLSLNMPKVDCEEISMLKSQIDLELAKMRSMTPQEAAAAAARAVAEAEVAMAEAEEAARDADEAEADAEAAQAFADAAAKMLRGRSTPKMQMMRA